MYNFSSSRKLAEKIITPSIVICSEIKERSIISCLLVGVNLPFLCGKIYLSQGIPFPFGGESHHHYNTQAGWRRDSPVRGAGYEPSDKDTHACLKHEVCFFGL